MHVALKDCDNDVERSIDQLVESKGVSGVVTIKPKVKSRDPPVAHDRTSRRTIMAY